MNFEEIEHTADRAFRVGGRDFEELLENTARARSSLNRLRPSGEPSADDRAGLHQTCGGRCRSDLRGLPEIRVS